MIKLGSKLENLIDRNDPRYKKLVEANPRLARKDPDLWGPNTEASIRLNWVDLPESSKSLLPVLQQLSQKFKGNNLVLCGMGGSSLAPEVIAATFDKKIFVFDLTDPNYAAHVLESDLRNTVVVVSSKSGSTIETASQRIAMQNLLIQQGLNPTDHIIFVTDPGSPLDISARSEGFTVINADPNVGGRYSALSAFGLVPAALIDVDVEKFLDTAAQQRLLLTSNENVAVDLAYLMWTQSEQFIAFADSKVLPGLSDWIEQLIAESTGKDRKGRLPVVIGSATDPIGSDQLLITFDENGVQGELSEHFIVWEWATALLGYVLGIDPFNQPNVTEAKNQTTNLLKDWNNKLPHLKADFSDGNVEIFGNHDSIKSELKSIVDEDGGYIAILAYLDRQDDQALVELRKILAEKSRKPVTFGWGPRFQHSTGQFHKAGQPNGSFLIITSESSRDFQIKDFSFKTLVMAQALGESAALNARKYPVSRLHLRDRALGISEILNAAKEI